MTAGLVIYLLYTETKNVYVWFTAFLLGGLICGQVLFGLVHPYMCNQDFRYVALLPLPMAMVWTMTTDKMTPLWRRNAAAVLFAFALMAAGIWWYVGMIRL